MSSLTRAPYSRLAQIELAKLRSTPTDAELAVSLNEAITVVSLTWEPPSFAPPSSLPEVASLTWVCSLTFRAAYIGTENSGTTAAPALWQDSCIRDRACSTRRGLDKVEGRMGSPQEDIHNVRAVASPDLGFAKCSCVRTIGGSSSGYGLSLRSC